MAGSPAYCEIRVEGLLDSRWEAWFSGLQIEGEDTQKVISGMLPDQPALRRLLAKIRDLGLCLISVRRLELPASGGWSFIVSLPDGWACVG